MAFERTLAWYTPIVPAFWEADARREGCVEQRSKTPTKKYSASKKKKKCLSSLQSCAGFSDFLTLILLCNYENPYPYPYPSPENAHSNVF